MFRSLQLRLPAFFLAGIVLAGVVAAVIAVRLFQNYARDQSLSDLKREAAGLTQLYQAEAGKKIEPGSARFFAPKRLEKATGDRLFYVGTDIFPGQASGLTRLPRSTVDFRQLERNGAIVFEFRPPKERRTFLAVAHRVSFRGHVFGALVVATPKTALRSTWVRLLERLALALLAGVVVAGALAAYLSRRITRPVLGLSRAADEVAEGRYDVAVPDVPGGGEVGHLADRFREMASRLREADEMERNFLMTVSHELRTPLTAIRGHLEALREGVVEDERAREESFEVIAAETDRLERLVGDVLDLAKLDARRFTLLREEVDMERLVDRAYSGFNEEARRRAIDYRREISARPVIETDGDRVLQVISNLLANAFRWTPDGGRVELELSAVDGTIRVAVDDSGPGITPQERERIFRPFWSRDGGGTGLGLAIARELAVALGGRIELESAPGQGSRFLLVLPANQS
ncbi:MAG: HAMP domain-containing histidine kinase [Actinomycetota bacterium]|nr:HAMP domain-containing histidine kinase [Actinomycetota bacterium]